MARATLMPPPPGSKTGSEQRILGPAATLGAVLAISTVGFRVMVKMFCIIDPWWRGFGVVCRWRWHLYNEKTDFSGSGRLVGEKTGGAAADVAGFLEAVVPERRRADGLVLEALFREVTGFQPRMWGASIVGYGAYHYRYDSGREGDSLATGFSPRMANMVLYIMPGYQDYSDILSGLGKHRLGKSCLYLGSLKNVDMDVLATLIRRGLADLDRKWPVQGS